MLGCFFKNSIDDFTKEILRRLNNFDANLNLKSIAYHTLQDTDTYIGCPAWTEEFTQYRREWFGKPVKIEFFAGILNCMKLVAFLIVLIGVVLCVKEVF